MFRWLFLEPSVLPAGPHAAGKISATILIAAIYAVGASIALGVGDAETACLGILFVSAAPIVASLFFGKRSALTLMAINLVPFLSRHGRLTTPDLSLATNRGLIESLLFVLFNVGLPLAVVRLLHARTVAGASNAAPIDPRVQPQELVARRDAAELNAIEQALKRSEEDLAFLSRHDALTRLPNRKSLRAHLAQTLPELKGDMVVAMVSIRLNSIRLANEQFGALVGDAFIQRFAEELRKTVPANAFCARLRSIVFPIVLAPTRSADDVVEQVERLRHQMPQEITVDGHRLIVLFSTGIALARAGDTSPEELMQRSEVALDSARRSTEDAAALFDEADAAQIRRRIEIELGIVAALQQGEFRLVYQPKVDDQGEIAGMETLIRWTSPALGEVSPTEFIPIAESSGLIRGITRFVVEETCRFIRQTIDSGRRCPPVSLNLSAVDVIRHDLLELIDDACARHATPAGLLEFEITETGLIGNEALAIHHLRELKRRGSRIAIDDFGTGYSSFSKLSSFPVSSIKIDHSFVSRIGQCAKSEAIIKAIVSLAKLLSCTSIAEGVEDEAQERFLKAIGCQQFQGYYHYRPLEAEQLSEHGLLKPLGAADCGASTPAAATVWPEFEALTELV